MWAIPYKQNSAGIRSVIHVNSAESNAVSCCNISYLCLIKDSGIALCYHFETLIIFNNVLSPSIRWIYNNGEGKKFIQNFRISKIGVKSSAQSEQT